MAKLNILAGMTYFGPHERRLFVREVKGNKIIVVAPLSWTVSEMTRAEFTAFAKGSERRTYRHSETGEVRTRLQTTEDGAVHFLTPERTLHEASGDDWAAWRGQAE